MGRLIDEWDIDDKKAEAWIVKGKMQIRYHGSIHNIELSTVGLIPKADYENRLKADLVAMLTELKSNIDELASSYDVPNIYVEIGMKEIENEIQDLIQQKINFLSGL